jgi:3-isopropylmalate dehydrogenase
MLKKFLTKTTKKRVALNQIPSRKIGVVMKKILALPGDGIGKEVTKEAVKILHWVKKLKPNLFELDFAEIGEEAIQKNNSPLADEVLEQAKLADAILVGAVGGSEWANNKNYETPESALLKLRSELNVFVNLRPVNILDALLDKTALKPSVLKNTDLIFVRELISDVYYGEPRGFQMGSYGREAINTMYYNEEQIRKIAKFAFSLAMQRNKKVCSVGKHNVLEVSQLWRDVINEVAKDYPEVMLTHLYVDNANLQLVKNPQAFDVVLTGNLFGDILSELAGAYAGSIGCAPSASLAHDYRGIYEPIHGTAPDIAGKNIANPIGSILSVAMMFQRFPLAFGDLTKSIS